MSAAEAIGCNGEVPPVSLLRPGLPQWAERRVTTLEPGESCGVRPELQDGLIVLEFGEIELEDATGATVWLDEHAVFSLSRDQAVSLRNTGSGRAVIASLTRRSGSPQ